MPLVFCEPKALSSPSAHSYAPAPRSFFIGISSGSLRTGGFFFPFGSRLFHRSCLWFPASRKLFLPLWLTSVYWLPGLVHSLLAFFHCFSFSFPLFLIRRLPFPGNVRGIKQKSPLLPGGRKAALQTADYLEGFGPSAMPKAARKGSIPFLSPCGCPFLTWSRGRAGRPPAPHIPFCRRRGSG